MRRAFINSHIGAEKKHEFLQPQYAITAIDPGGRCYSMSVSRYLGPSRRVLEYRVIKVGGT